MGWYQNYISFFFWRDTLSQFLIEIVLNYVMETTQQTFVGLEDVLKTSSWHVLKTSWRYLEDMSWRPLNDFMETNKILGISVYLSRYLTNLNVYLTNLYFTNLYLIILRRIQNALIRTHHFNIRFISELKQHVHFKN